MHANAPIGLFDSGVGGLTIMREVAALLPEEDLVYLGDTARLPYGNKSPEAICRFAIDNANFLIQQNIKLLVISCHTACSHAFDYLQQHLGIPVIGVTSSGFYGLLKATKTKRVAILGTRSTISSGLFQSLLKIHDPNVEAHLVACPLFVPLVEEGFQNHLAAQLIAKEYLSFLQTKNIDAALLACTHYPLLASIIQEVLGPKVSLVIPAQATASEVRDFLKKENLLNTKQKKGSYCFYASDDPEKFRHLAKIFFSHPIETVHLAHL